MVHRCVEGKKMRRISGVLRLGGVAAFVVGLLALQVACGSAEATLPGAVYAKVVPVYPGAEYDESMGGKSGDDIGGPVTAESTSWFFRISDPVDKVIAFYREKLPGAKLAKDDLGDDVFTFIPTTAEEGEYVSVTIRKGGELQIGESLRPGKKQS